MCICMRVHKYIYIYIERERENIYIYNTKSPLWPGRGQLSCLASADRTAIISIVYNRKRNIMLLATINVLYTYIIKEISLEEKTCPAGASIQI